MNVASPSVVRRALGRVVSRRRMRAVVRRFRIAPPSRGWASPLRLARRCLDDAVKARAHHARGWMLDVGCGYQPYRRLFSHVDRYVGLDAPGSGLVDVGGDALALPFRGAAFDTVLCNQVLEHVPEPATLLREVGRVLKPAGTLLLTAPQTWGLHHEPHDFYRYTKYGLRYLAESNGLRVVDIAATCGMWTTVTQRVADTVVHTYAARRPRWMVEVLSVLLAPLLLAGEAADRLAGRQGDTLDYVLVATKA
jgi:SAM-dependent methyltransferase